MSDERKGLTEEELLEIFEKIRRRDIIRPMDSKTGQTYEQIRQIIKYYFNHLLDKYYKKPKIDEKYVEEKANDIADTIIDYLPDGQYGDTPIELNKLRDFITQIISDAKGK